MDRNHLNNQGSFLWGLVKIQSVVNEMSFEEIVYGRTDARTDGRTTDKMWSQKLILSPCDRWAKQEAQDI